jgi:hypothetical protein
MSRPGSRQQLIDYCLRKLGEPVIEINVDPDQIEDRVDEAIQYFIEYHNQGIQRTYINHIVTQDDLDNDYIPIADDVVQVLRVLPLGDIGNTSFNMFDASYQMMFDAVNKGFTIAGDMAYYEQMQQHLSLLDMKLNGTPQFNWSRYNNKLHMFGDLNDGDISVGDYIVMEAMVEIRPETTGTSSTIYDNMFIKEFTTALIKQQWGANLIKFEGMQLPGGVTLNGRQIFEDAMQDIEKLQERLRLEFEEPVDFFVG